jgi:hypothetical protein
MEIRPVGAETDGRTDMTKRIVVPRSFVNAPKNVAEFERNYT